MKSGRRSRSSRICAVYALFMFCLFRFRLSQSLRRVFLCNQTLLFDVELIRIVYGPFTPFVIQ